MGALAPTSATEPTLTDEQQDPIIACLIQQLSVKAWWGKYDSSQPKQGRTQEFRAYVEGQLLPAAAKRQIEEARLTAKSAAARERVRKKEAREHEKVETESAAARTKRAALVGASKPSALAIHVKSAASAAARKASRGAGTVGRGMTTAGRVMGEKSGELKRGVSKRFDVFTTFLKFKIGKGPPWEELFLFLLADQAQTEFSLEGVSFAIEANAMRKMPVGTAEQREAKRAVMCDLYKNYVDHSSPQSINIAHGTRLNLHRYITQTAEGEMDTADMANWFIVRTDAERRTLEAFWHSAEQQCVRLVRDTFNRLRRDEIRGPQLTQLITRYRDEILPAVGGCQPTEDLARSMHYGALFDDSFIDSNHYHHEKRMDYAHSHAYGDIDYADFGEYDAGYYSHPSPLNGDRYWSGLLVGGVFGGTAIVFILLVFCIGLAFGMVTWWAYTQQRALVKSKEKEVYWNANDEENGSN